MVVQKVLCYALLALLHSAGNCRSKQLWVAGPKFASTIPFPAQSRCRHDEHSLNGSDDAKWWCQGILLHDITKAPCKRTAGRATHAGPTGKWHGMEKAVSLVRICTQTVTAHRITAAGVTVAAVTRESNKVKEKNRTTTVSKTRMKQNKKEKEEKAERIWKKQARRIAMPRVKNHN